MMVHMFFAGVFLLPFFVQRFCSAHLTKQFLCKTLPAGVFLTSATILTYTALDTLLAGVGIALHYTYPLVVMVLSVLLFRACITLRAVTALLISLVGMLLCFLDVFLLALYSLATEISGELGGFTDELEANRLNSTVSLFRDDRNMV